MAASHSYSLTRRRAHSGRCCPTVSTARRCAAHCRCKSTLFTRARASPPSGNCTAVYSSFAREQIPAYTFGPCYPPTIRCTRPARQSWHSARRCWTSAS
eukprot:1067412-Rhodomonas_salina.1